MIYRKTINNLYETILCFEFGLSKWFLPKNHLIYSACKFAKTAGDT